MVDLNKKRQSTQYDYNDSNPLADPGGGAHPARAPPNGRGPMIFCAKKRYFFSIFSSLASLAITFKHYFTLNMTKTRSKMTFISTFNTFNDFLLLP